MERLCSIGGGRRKDRKKWKKRKTWGETERDRRKTEGPRILSRVDPGKRRMTEEGCEVIRRAERLQIVDCKNAY